MSKGKEEGGVRSPHSDVYCPSEGRGENKLDFFLFSLQVYVLLQEQAHCITEGPNGRNLAVPASLGQQVSMKMAPFPRRVASAEP